MESNENTTVQTREATTVIEAQERANIDIQVQTAKRYPRDVKRFMEEVRTMATLSPEVAESCFYALPPPKNSDDDKPIEGPSVRFAEIVYTEWGNCRAGARVVEVGEKMLRAQAVFQDLERNTAITFEVQRSILTKSGRKFPPHLITTVGNAACGIAFRNVVFKGVPKAYWNGAYLAARKASGGGDPIEVQRRKIVAYFRQMAKGPEDLCQVLGRDSIDDITEDDILILRGIATAIREGLSVEEAFNQADSESAYGDRPDVSDINSALEDELEDDDEPESDPGSEPDGEIDWGPDDDEPEPEPEPEPPTPKKAKRTAPKKKKRTAAPEPEEQPPSSDLAGDDGPRAPFGKIDQVREAAMQAGVRPSALEGLAQKRYGRATKDLTKAQADDLLAHIGDQ